MADEIGNARRALARGDAAEALVYLWNAVEPARLEGDARALAAIASLAQQVRARGDEGQAREAERLIERLRGGLEAAETGLAPATEQLDAEVYAGGEQLDPGDFETADAEEEGETSRAARIGNLVWLGLVLLIVLVNVLGQIRDGG